MADEYNEINKLQITLGGKMAVLRDFLYLDTGKLNSYVSQIQGGIVEEITQTMKQIGGLSAGINVGIPQVGANIDASKGKESERQQTIHLTNPAYFNILYQYLEKEKQITKITSRNLYEDLEVGEFVEIGGTAEPPIVDDWIERVKALFGFFEKHLKVMLPLQPKTKNNKRGININGEQMKQYKDIMNMLYDYIEFASLDPRKHFVIMNIEDMPFRAWCSLLPEYELVPLRTALPAEVKVLGQVDKILSEGDEVRIVDFSKLSMNNGIDNLLNAINELGPLAGVKQIQKEDFEAKHPEIFIKPLAIFR